MITPEILAAPGREDDHQAALFCWAAQQAQSNSRLHNLYSVPNGGKRDKSVARRMKRTGLRAGVPDVKLACTNTIFSGLYIELKLEKYKNRKNGGCSDEQLRWHERLRNENYSVKVCYGWLDAANAICEYLAIPVC